MQIEEPCYWEAYPEAQNEMARLFWDSMQTLCTKVPDAVVEHPVKAVQANADSLNRKLLAQTCCCAWVPHFYMELGPFPGSFMINVQFIPKLGLPPTWN